MDIQRKAYYAYKIGNLQSKWNHQFVDYCGRHPKVFWGPLVAKMVWWFLGEIGGAAKKLGWQNAMHYPGYQPIYNRTRLELITLAIKQHCKPEQNWALTNKERRFYTIKCIWCLIWNMQAQSDRPRWVGLYGPDNPNAMEKFAADPITVAVFNAHRFHTQEYTADEWQELIIGSSSYDWRYSIETDTST